MPETLQEKIARVTKETVDIVSYNPKWPQLFLEEKKHLLKVLTQPLIKRIEHFGSTAVPGLDAKPIIDVLVEVTDLEATRNQIVPILEGEGEGYDYFWRPGFENDPYYAWFIKRDKNGVRTHHIHMVESDSRLWERLYFRDYLKEFPETAREYAGLKNKLSKEHPNDRVAYTEAKGDFVEKVTKQAMTYYEP